MSGKEYVSIESLRLQAELLVADFLTENEIITESEYKVGFIGSTSLYLLESASRQDSPAYWYGDIHYNDFKLVWNNVRDYPKTISVWRMFHPKTDMTDIEKATKSANSWARRILRKFLRDLQQASTELTAKSADERNRLVASLDRGDIDPDHFPIDASIDTGRQRRGSRTGNLERASQLFAGDLYGDESRIPLRRWGSWWKRYIQARTSVDTGSKIFAITNWTRHFILGYAIDKSILFEIWYSSHDGTFSVHDRFGNPVRRGENIPLMRDALNLLFHNIAEFSPEDEAILRGSGPDLRRINQDIARMLSGSVTSAADHAARMTDRKERIRHARKKAEIEAEVKRGRAEIDAEARERERQEKADEKARNKEQTNSKAFSDGIRGAAQAAKKTYEYTKRLRVLFNGIQRRMNGIKEKKSKMDNLLKTTSELGVAIPTNSIRLRRSNSAVDDWMKKANQAYEDIAKAPVPETKEDMEKMLTDVKRIEKILEDTDKAVKDYEKTATEIIDELKDEHRRMRAEVQQANSRSQTFDRNVRDLNRRDKKTLKDRHPELDVNKKRKKGTKKSINENVLDQLDSVKVDPSVGRDLSDYAQNPLYQEKVNNEVDRVRNNSETSTYTRQVISAMFYDGFVKTYNETRVRRRNVFVRILERFFRLFRGRPQPIALPTKVASRRQRVRGFFAGTQVRADFIIGYTINEKANYEIWYVQELSHDAKRQLSSFYLYDVTSEKIIEGNLPHYRNAIHALMLKIGADVDVEGPGRV